MQQLKNLLFQFGLYPSYRCHKYVLATVEILVSPRRRPLRLHQRRSRPGHPQRRRPGVGNEPGAFSRDFRTKHIPTALCRGISSNALPPFSGLPPPRNASVLLQRLAGSIAEIENAVDLKRIP